MEPPFAIHWPTLILTLVSVVGGAAVRHYWWVWRYRRDMNVARRRMRMERYSRRPKQR